MTLWEPSAGELCRYSGAFDDVELKLWDGCRHELLNETNRLEVYKNISDWLEEKLG